MVDKDCQHQMSPDESYMKLVCVRGCGYFEWLNDNDYPDPDDDGYCETCGGEGVIITCIDDLCVGAGECMHGDGEELCPDCDGEY